MINARIDKWNQTYAECSVVVQDIASLLRLREISPNDAVTPPTAGQQSFAELWMAALEPILLMVYELKSDPPEPFMVPYGYLELLEQSRDDLLLVRTELQKLWGTEEFEALRHCMGGAAAKAYA